MLELETGLIRKKRNERGELTPLLSTVLTKTRLTANSCCRKEFFCLSHTLSRCSIYHLFFLRRQASQASPTPLGSSPTPSISGNCKSELPQDLLSQLRIPHHRLQGCREKNIPRRFSDRRSSVVIDRQAHPPHLSPLTSHLTRFFPRVVSLRPIRVPGRGVVRLSEVFNSCSCRQ